MVGRRGPSSWEFRWQGGCGRRRKGCVSSTQLSFGVLYGYVFGRRSEFLYEKYYDNAKLTGWVIIHCGWQNGSTERGRR